MDADLFSGHDPHPPEAGWFIAHCDGGARGNPGPAGYGAVIEDPQGSIVARLSEYLGKQTNNYAEYQALLAVLKWANENGAKRLRVVSDSELMVNQMKGRYKVASPGLRPLWEEARRRAAKLERFEMKHTLRGGNKEADRLANEAMDRGMGKPAAAASAETANRQGREVPMHASGPASNAKPDPLALQGFVKNGVIHLLEGELPEDTLVTVIRNP